MSPWRFVSNEKIEERDEGSTDGAVRAKAVFATLKKNLSGKVDFS